MKIPEDCKRGKYVIADHLPNMDTFKNISFPHGLQAYCGYESEIKDRVEYITNNPQTCICCGLPGQHIGIIGLYIEGNVKVVNEVDLQSNILPLNSKRVFNEDFLFPLDNPEELSKVDISVTGEVLIKDTRITGIWAKQDCPQDIIDEVRSIIDLPVSIVKDYSSCILFH